MMTDIIQTKLFLRFLSLKDKGRKFSGAGFTLGGRCGSLAHTSISADSPSGKVPTTLVRQIVKEVTQKYTLGAVAQSRLPMQVNPEAMLGNDTGAAWSTTTIHHGESAKTLLAGGNVEAVAELVKALNRHCNI